MIAVQDRRGIAFNDDVMPHTDCFHRRNEKRWPATPARLRAARAICAAVAAAWLVAGRRHREDGLDHPGVPQHRQDHGLGALRVAGLPRRRSSHRRPRLLDRPDERRRSLHTGTARHILGGNSRAVPDRVVGAGITLSRQGRGGPRRPGQGVGPFRAHDEHRRAMNRNGNSLQGLALRHVALALFGLALFGVVATGCSEGPAVAVPTPEEGPAVAVSAPEEGPALSTHLYALESESVRLKSFDRRGGRRRRRTLHRNLQGTAPLDPRLRHRRGTQPGPPGMAHPLQ